MSGDSFMLRQVSVQKFFEDNQARLGLTWLAVSVLVPADKGPEPVSTSGWYVQAGLHRVHLSRSVDDIIATLEVELPGDGATPL